VSPGLERGNGAGWALEGEGLVIMGSNPDGYRGGRIMRSRMAIWPPFQWNWSVPFPGTGGVFNQRGPGVYCCVTVSV
jgi:hypothetical protein